MRLAHDERRTPLRRRIALALLAVVAIGWAIPGPVPALVAQQEPLLLGRYTAGHFAALALGTIVLGLVATLLWSRRGIAECIALLLLATGSTAAAVVIVASVARETISPRYVARPVESLVADPALRARLGGPATTREPNFRWEVLREDLPAPGRTYPNRAPGHPAIPVTLTTDDRGLRNPPRTGSYDVVVAGDSFTEGSMVSDDQTWWHLLAARTGLRVYNTGVSGLTVREYLNNWAAFGLDTGARTLVVTVYEGNDWKPLAPLPPRPARGAALPSPSALPTRAGVPDWLPAFSWDPSPLRARTELALVQLLAPIGADWPTPATEGLSWMPVPVHAGGATRHYAFEPKHMMRLDWEPAAFAAAPEWTTNEAVLAELAALARERGVRLILAYAPVKPHVVLPLVRDQVTAGQLRAFAAYRAGRHPALPPAEPFRARLFAHLDTQEHVLRDWCAAERIEFVSLTAPLRERMAQGDPVYFTYDPHWTERGHLAVADHLAAYLGGR